jgi:tRNA-2-methylthio-N6-dimethylallyladenosine synthase
MRPGTPGAAMPDQLPEAVKEARLAALQSLLRAQQTAFNERAAGRTIEVLFKERGRREGQLIGKSPWLQSVHLVTDARIGDLIEVRIEAGYANSVAGIETVRAAA